jgi:hypothetical protein
MNAKTERYKATNLEEGVQTRRHGICCSLRPSSSRVDKQRSPRLASPSLARHPQQPPPKLVAESATLVLMCDLSWRHMDHARLA